LLRARGRFAAAVIGKGAIVDAGDIAALIAAGAFLMLVLVACVPIYRLRHTVDAATAAIADINAKTAPLLGNVNTTVDNLNTALTQVHTSLDGVNAQLVRVDTITGHAAAVSANVANLATVVTSAASSPIVKVAALGYGVRRAAARRRTADEEAEVRSTLKEQRKAARRAR
jgi:uncharacterized protein YoxC